MGPVEPRLAPLPESDWSDEVRQILEPLRSMGEGRVFNIFATLARHPALLRRWLGFGSHVLIQSSLPPRERELVILRVGWLCGSEYEWGQHVAIARGLGVTPVEIGRVVDGADAPGWEPREAALLRAADELHAATEISESTWSELATHLDEKQLLDLIFTVGQYTLVSMALKTLRVPLDPGLARFPEPSR